MNHCFEANKAKAEKNYYILFNKTCKNSQKKQKIVDETDSKKKICCWTDFCTVLIDSSKRLIFYLGTDV